MTYYSDKTRIDNNRTSLSLQRSDVNTVLPEHIKESYPKLVELFNAYYEYLDSADNFGWKIKQLYSNKDATQVPSSLLQYLEDELLLGQAYFGGFQNKREAVKFSNTLYRSKGTKYSIEQFFRGFFGTDPIIEYPKNDIFIVGPAIDYDLDSINTSGQQIKSPASEIGPEASKFLTNDELYQVMSILVKSNIPFNEWKDIYKLFVHPAGVYVAGQVLLEIVNVSWNNVAHDPALPNNGAINYIMDEVGDPTETLLGTGDEAGLASDAFSEVTLIKLGDGTVGLQRQRTDQDFFDIGSRTISDLGTGYDMEELLSPNSITMDDSNSKIFAVTDAQNFSTDSSGILGTSTFDQHEYSTLFDSINSADSADYV